MKVPNRRLINIAPHFLKKLEWNDKSFAMGQHSAFVSFYGLSSVMLQISSEAELCDVLCRIAFQLLEFSDMVSGGEAVEPSGPSLLASRCLETAGYKVVQVSALVQLV